MISGIRILIVVLFESVNIWVTDKEKFFKPIRNRNEGEDGSNWSLNKLNIRKKTGVSGRGGAGGSVFIRILTFNRRKNLWMEIKEYQRFGMIKKYFFGSGSVLYTDPGRSLDREGEK